MTPSMIACIISLINFGILVLMCVRQRNPQVNLQNDNQIGNQNKPNVQNNNEPII